MLVFLVLCAFLGTLKGAPLVPPHPSSSVASSGLMAREALADPDCDGPQCRTVYAILQSCLLTIFACVWTSAHPNINGPRDSCWACLKRKVVTMLCALIAPEMVLYWALRQRDAAKKIAERYNTEFARTGVEEDKSLWGKVVGWFLSPLRMVTGWFSSLPKATTRRGEGQSWTTTHGFFIQMGGFILYEDEYPKQVLDYVLLAELLRNKRIDAPTVTERELQDRSKGDTISNAIVVLQTMWFALQCVARWGQRLPLSELEVLTFAFAVVNVAIYTAWWNKLQGADTAICVPLKKVGQSPTPLMGEQHLSCPGPASFSQLHSDDSLLLGLAHKPEQAAESADGKQSWMRRMIRKDRKQSHCFFLFLPYRIVAAVIRLFLKMGDAKFRGGIEENDLRVPMFYASSWDDDRDRSSQASLCVVGTIFGAIHLTTWTSEVASPGELVIWRASAVLLTLVPFLTLLGWALNMLGMEVIAESIFWSTLHLVPFYIASRFTLITVALLSIRHPPPSVLLDVSWTLYMPHL